VTAVFLALGGSICLSQTAANGNITTSETHQTIEGFGASVFYYSNWLVAHPNKEAIYEKIFLDLGLDILRLGNVYGYTQTFNPDAAEIVSMAEAYLGRPVKVMISSWSPPAYLKSNGQTKNGGTLVKINGEYDYEGYAQYWADALDAYAQYGIEPVYVSIQNEPDWSTSWETCEFSETETANKAGYDKALDAVYRKFQEFGSPPKLLAPEAKGIGDGRFRNYISHFNRDQVYGYAHHLYNGGDANNPDSFIGAMQATAKDGSDKPRFQTEYSSGSADWLKTAWLIHNSLVFEEVSAYFHWGLIWGGLDNSELVQLENPWDRGNWKTHDGYAVTDRYWAFRQFSNYIKPGWKRVSSTASPNTVKLSAFISADGDSLTAVAINTGTAAFALTLDFGGYQFDSGSVIRTSDSEQGVELGAYDGTATLDLPARSITTLAIEGAPTSVRGRTVQPSGSLTTQNYPNPFNSTTTIRFHLPKDGEAGLTVFDLGGRIVHEKRFGFLRAGAHSFSFDASGLASGVYCYRIGNGDGNAVFRKFILAR
jgi:glucuronoarabinoxylan endo-1,4-beta-xylanase